MCLLEKTIIGKRKDCLPNTQTTLNLFSELQREEPTTESQEGVGHMLLSHLLFQAYYTTSFFWWAEVSNFGRDTCPPPSQTETKLVRNLQFDVLCASSSWHSGSSGLLSEKAISGIKQKRTFLTPAVYCKCHGGGGGAYPCTIYMTACVQNISAHVLNSAF